MVAKKPKEPVENCTQCMEDAIMEIRKDAKYTHEIYGLINDCYLIHGKQRKDGVTVTDFVNALISAEHDQRRLRKMLHEDAKRLVRETDSLVEALRFVSAACQCGSSGVSVGSSAVSLNVSQLFRTAIDRLQSIQVPYKGLLDGKQPQNDIDFMAHLWKES